MPALVARSYIELPQIGEVFTSNGKEYVQIKMKNGSIKTVRAYGPDEYKKYYPDLAKLYISEDSTFPVDGKDHSNDIHWKTQKEILGFSNGFIWIFTGDTYAAKDWFKERGYYYRKLWGWSIPGDEELPADLPAGITPIKLSWESVGKGDNLLNDDIVKTAVENAIYEPTDSEYQGSIGDRLELTVVVEKVVDYDGNYGTQHIHTFRDEDGNAYVWSTTSKRWEEGEEKHIRGTISAHKLFRGDKQTWLKRCIEIKK